jgi:hypothetical protein
MHSAILLIANDVAVERVFICQSICKIIMERVASDCSRMYSVVALISHLSSLMIDPALPSVYL